MPTLPPDPIYQSDIGAIDLDYNNRIAGVNFDRIALGQESGFDQAGNLDPSNPFSIAANLQRRYQQGQAGTTNSMAAQGQLYSGATQRNLDEGTYQYGRSYDSARRTAAGGYQDLLEREQGAGFNRTMGRNEADAARLGRVQPQDTVPTTPAQPAPTSQVSPSIRQWGRSVRNRRYVGRYERPWS